MEFKFTEEEFRKRIRQNMEDTERERDELYRLLDDRLKRCMEADQNGKNDSEI